jgi:hypothetical protein
MKMKIENRGGKRANAGRPLKADKIKQKGININISYYHLLLNKSIKDNKSIKNIMHDIINFWLANQEKHML